MDKKEILERISKEGPDEREQKIYQESWNFAGTAVCIICVFFIIFNLIKGKNGYSYCFIGMAYCSADNLYRYYKLRKGSELFSGLAFLTAALIWLVLYFING